MKASAATGSTRVIAVATANEEVAWAEGKLSELGRAAQRRQPLEDRSRAARRAA